MHNQPNKIRCVALLPYIVNSEVRVLLQKRSALAELLPGCFGFFGGAIEANETSAQALEREAFEELRIKLDSYGFFSRYEFYGRTVDVYTLEVNTDWLGAINLHEGEYARLFTEGECALEERLILPDKVVLRNFFGLKKRNNPFS